MHQFVWARVFCGIRYGYPVVVDCSGTVQKIHMRKIKWRQGREHAWKCHGFLHVGTFDETPGTLRALGSALTRNVSSSHGSKILLQRAILYRHERILLGREDCRPGPKKTIWGQVAVFSLISRDASIRLGSLLLWHQIWVSCCCGLQRDHPEHPYEKDQLGRRSRECWDMCWISACGDV